MAEGNERLMFERLMSDGTIVKCDKCDEVYPTIIFTCEKCNNKVGWARAYDITYPSRHLCFECWQILDDKAWRYDQLDK